MVLFLLSDVGSRIFTEDIARASRGLGDMMLLNLGLETVPRIVNMVTFEILVLL